MSVAPAAFLLPDAGSVVPAACNTRASICLVTSGSAGAPSGVENLMPLYSGGLCEAVKLMAPSAFSRITSQAIAGVGAASEITSGVMP